VRLYDRSPAAAVLTVVLLSAALLGSVAGCGGGGPSGASNTSAPPSASTPTSTHATKPMTTGAPGRALFAARCGSCHTLKAAGTSGQVGPNLDAVRPNQAQVKAAIAEGPGPMPPNLVRGKQADQVAAFVASMAGK
jgi:mono/diheme cytochrome c family protein